MDGIDSGIFQNLLYETVYRSPADRVRPALETSPRTKGGGGLGRVASVASAG